MDQHTVTVRRHNSLPGRVRRSTPALERMSQQLKFNPYVGCFRHSPETSSAPKATTTNLINKLPENHPFQVSLKSQLQASPYVGYFRHSPNAAALFKAVEDEFMLKLKAALPAIKLTYDHVQELADFLAGRLRGGSPSDSYKGFNHQSKWLLDRQQQSPSILASSRLLDRVASWILSPFLEEHGKLALRANLSSSSLKSLDNDSLSSTGAEDAHYDTDNTEDHDDDDDEYSCHDSDGVRHSLDMQHRRCVRSSSLGESSSIAARDAVSSQAEAYYAHQAAMELDPDEVIPSRLDYIITQMDIIRMQRNACRHLDVESIYQLPTVTYEGRKTTTPTPKSPTASQEGSWMLVSHSEQTAANPNDRPATTDNKQQADHEDVCVICLEQFVAGDRIRVLPCDHSFHIGCIDRWLSGSASFDECHTAGCPTCKKRPVAGTEAEEQGLPTPDGAVPSWAFSQLGSALMARDSSQAA